MTAAPLPRLLVLTDRHRCPWGLAPALAGAVLGGARAIVVREKDLRPEERLLVAAHAVALLGEVGGTTLLASGPVPPPTSGIAGVHLAAADPWPEGVAPGGDVVVGRSCHDAAEVRRAVEEGASHVTVSPVFPTPSKPGYGPALGSDGLAALVEVAGGVPVYALGGVTAATVPACLDAGAYGVAVLGAVMAADDPRSATAALLEPLHTAAQEAPRARTR